MLVCEHRILYIENKIPKEDFSLPKRDWWNQFFFSVYFLEGFKTFQKIPNKIFIRRELQ